MNKKHLKIKYIKIKNNKIIAQMNTINQLYGYVNGGCVLFLAETIGSYLSYININHKKYLSLCIEISANHIKTTSDKTIIGESKIIHKGKMLHFIQVHIYNTRNKLISQCKMSNIIIKKHEKKN